MVKASRYTTLAATALLLAAACTQLDPGYTYRDDPDAVRISAQVGDEAGSGSFATRSNPVPVSYMPEEEWSFNPDDRVCVTADGQPAVVYAYDGSSWTPEGSKFLKWNSSTMDFTAWYPAAEGVNADNFTVPADQSNADKIASADYMTCSKQITRDGDKPVSLIFERKMARIMVIPRFNNQFNDVDYTVSEVIVCGNTKGYASGRPASGSVEVKAYNNGTFYALLSPTSLDSDATFIKVKVVKNDGTEEYSLEAKGIIATEAGKSYIVNLTVGKNVASVSGVTVLDWSFKDSITGSEADQIPYITFSAANEQRFTMDFQPQSRYEAFSLEEGDYFEYSVGGGKWTKFTTTVSDVAFGGAKGNLRLRGKSSKGTADSYTISSTISFTTSNSPVQCTGDIRTLIDYESYASANTESARFCNLFNGCSQLTTAPDLPATTLARYCYYYMFYGCTALTTAPSDLLAATLPDYCYTYMFSNCSNLTTAPIIHADVMQGGFCCNGMFNGCSSLTTVQDELPAMTLSKYCYYGMFKACSSLTKAPKLPATTLAVDCYHSMFSDCTNLYEAPELPAETLVQSCYWDMFRNCSNLSSVTMKAKDVSVALCLRDWLTNAGTEANSRTLTLANESIYNTISTLSTTQYYLPDNWKKDSEGTTVVYIDNTSTGE